MLEKSSKGKARWHSSLGYDGRPSGKQIFKVRARYSLSDVY